MRSLLGSLKVCLNALFLTCSVVSLHSELGFVDARDSLELLHQTLRSTLEYFYPGVDLSDSELPCLLSTLPARIRGCVKTATIKAGSLTLGILKSLYPKAALEVIADGWAAEITKDDACRLMQSFRDVAFKLVPMLGTEPEYGTGL